MVKMLDLEFYRGKRVFVTGHTGFKGSWLCKILSVAGAKVTGYSLTPPTDPDLFSLSGVEKDIVSVIGDVRDLASLKKAYDEARPEIVLHLAAQPIVITSYEEPKYTYETNVMDLMQPLTATNNETAKVSKDTNNLSGAKTPKNNKTSFIITITGR